MPQPWPVCSQLYSAQNITCTVTQDADQTTYRVQHVEGFDNPDEYSWSNANGTHPYVIAHHKERTDKCVKSKDISTLVTTKCFERIDYKLKFIQEVLHF
ncbi:uncharacterized protein AKAME5_002631000 [Lates japonicus]|uniref:Uncharacterized protein n=1 Tax=Lates japonicus TaxID=270547 RepID=A0AAD3NM83_LATJO|nr:uncharacterized protein AKAME5_002631000 [Lates japonicus]